MEEMELNMTSVNPDFWRNKRIFLTGHTGFKGGWLSLWLQSMGADIFGFALPPPTTPSLYGEARVAENMQSLFGDIRDYGLLLETMKKSRAEIVIHMAAQPLVRRSYQEPIETYATNIMGTVHVLEAARHVDTVTTVVNVTTDKCYENKEWIWGYREDDRLGGFDPYSSSKSCSELVTSSYRNSFFQSGQLALASARAGNVIGGGDWATDRLIPDILRAFEASRPLVIRNPTATRPWQHVLEPLSGYLILAERLHHQGREYSQAWNFGPSDDDVRSVEWIVEKIASYWGNSPAWEISSENHPHEANFLKLDISKSRNFLNWNPLLSLDEALGLTVDWYKSRLSGEDMRDVTIRQISNYQGIKSPLNKKQEQYK